MLSPSPNLGPAQFGAAPGDFQLLLLQSVAQSLYIQYASALPTRAAAQELPAVTGTAAMASCAQRPAPLQRQDGLPACAVTEDDSESS